MISLGFVPGHTPAAAFAPLLAAMGNVTPALVAAGETGMALSQERFDAGGAPGQPWAELTDETKARKEKSGHTNPLIGFAILKNSVAFDADGMTLKLTAAGPYALIHQFGGMAGRSQSVPIPARPYLPDDDAYVDTVNDLVREYVTEAYTT